MRLTLVRHATLLVELGGRRLLVDPMLDEEGARPPIGDTPNPVPNPTVGLPLLAEDVVRDLDGIVVTHLHADHLDETAVRLLPRGVPVLCQPPDVERLEGHGWGAWWRSRTPASSSACTSPAPAASTARARWPRCSPPCPGSC